MFIYFSMNITLASIPTLSLNWSYCIHWGSLVSKSRIDTYSLGQMVLKCSGKFDPVNLFLQHSCFFFLT